MEQAGFVDHVLARLNRPIVSRIFGSKDKKDRYR